MNKFTVMVLVGGIVFSLGCARVRVEAPKEPIRVDVSMRLDVYQHIEKDIDQIENMVSGGARPSVPKGDQSFLGFLVSEAHAQEGLGPEVEAAVSRRKDRRSQLSDLQSSGVIGEDASGMAVVRQDEASAQALVDAENADRQAIYKAVAEKNGGSVSDVQKLYAKRLQGDAPSGTPIETASGWTTK